MKKIILLIISIAFANLLLAENTTFDQANKAYSEGKYDEAIKCYESLQKNDEHSATIYYNLANAYFKKGALANALLNYERAYRLAPSDKDIKANLAFAQAQVADKIEQPKRYFFSKWIYGFIHQLNSNVWAYLGIVFWAILFLMLVLFLRSTSEQKRKIYFTIALVSLFVACFSFYSAYSQYRANFSEEYAIIFAKNTTANSTPSYNGTELFTLHEGTKVQILDKVGNWYKVQLADNREGWLPSKEIVKI